MRTRQTYALKLVIIASNDLSAFIVMALELSSFWAMLVLPQGCAFEGLWTSFRAGLPLTPSTGAIAACALTSMEMERRTDFCLACVRESAIVTDMRRDFSSWLFAASAF